MVSKQNAIDFLNEGLDSRTEYHFYEDRGVLAIRFYVGADRKRKTTSIACPEVVTTAFRAEARSRAVEIIGESRSGRVLEATPQDLIQVSLTLDELRDAWMREQVIAYPASHQTRAIQIANVCTVFKSVEDNYTPLQRLVMPYGPQTFVDRRMRQVAKETVKKEVGVMMQFVEWLHKKKCINAKPERPTYRKKDLGTRVGPQRDEPVQLDDETALAIINLLPEYTTRGSRHNRRTEKSFVCRDMMRFAFETALRPSTVARLAMSKHWSQGADVLRITPDIDKGRNEGQVRKVRVIPLTKVAKEILARHAPESGLIFGKHYIAVQWKRAAKAILGEELGSRCAPYDLRHGAITRMRELGGLHGTMHLAGHSQGTTTDKYTRPGEKAAAQVVAILDSRNAELEAGRKPGRKKKAPRAREHERPIL